jgi:serine/threonine-protein kinase
MLGNRYELLLPLASGGMGRVWRARDTLLERPVAVKVLRQELTGDATFRARFRAEAQHTAALHHPNVASVFDYGEVEVDGECLAYLVMELIEGEALSTLLEREGRLDPARTLDVLRQTSAALAAAHAAGLVHRDVKPGNVLVGNDGTVKIADFGIAWSASSVPLTGTGQVVGTAHYLSPEQADGGKATPASDVYALGTVAYECLAGRRAFDGENAVQIALKQIREEPAPLPADVPASIRAVVERAMAKDPAARYADGAELRKAVESAAVVSPTEPVAPSVPAPTATFPAPTGVFPAASSAAAPGPLRWLPRRPLTRVLAGVAAAFAVIAVLVGALAGPGGEDPASGASAAASSSSRSSSSAPSSAASSAVRTPAPVAVVAADLVGRPLAQVQAELSGRGLQVQTAAVQTGAVAAGLVTAVTPVGELAPGTAVTVSYAVAPVAAPAPAPAPAPVNTGGGNGTGKGDGHGKGHGHGKGD